MDTHPHTLGAIAYAIWTRSLGKPIDWENLPLHHQIAWNEMAVCIRNSDMFLSESERPPSRVVEETVDGGSFKVSANLGSGGTG